MSILQLMMQCSDGWSANILCKYQRDETLGRLESTLLNQHERTITPQFNDITMVLFLQLHLGKTEEMQKNKTDQISKTKEMQKKINYLRTEPSPNQIELY